MALNKFLNLIRTRGESIAKAFLAEDHNKDGDIGCDGMIAALLS